MRQNVETIDQGDEFVENECEISHTRATEMEIFVAILAQKNWGYRGQDDQK